MAVITALWQLEVNIFTMNLMVLLKGHVYKEFLLQLILKFVIKFFLNVLLYTN